jgi:ribosomal protein S18 acetylase RimI-like enzyme
MNLRIRAVEPEVDWSSIWPIFREAVQAGDTLVFPPDTDEEAARKYWLLPRPAGVFVAINPAEAMVVGTSFVRPNQPGLGGHVANAAFMVSSRVAGQGVGRALAEHALNWARQQGFSAMQFNFVVRTNTRAINLWKSLGFSIVGTLPEVFQHQGLGQNVDAFVMHRFL